MTPLPPTSKVPSGGKPRKVKPSFFASRPGKVMLVTAIISVLLHAAAGVATLRQPLGYVDPSALRDAQQPLRVKRATYDLVTVAGAGAGAGQQEDKPTLEAISEAMLADAAEPEPVQLPEPELDLRQIQEQQTEQPSGAMSVEVPGFELPTQVLAELTSQSPSELGYRDTPTQDAGEGSIAGGGSGVAEAQRLLAQAGMLPQGGGGGRGNGTGLGSPGGSAVRDTPAVDQRMLELPLSPPEIDFASVALEETTKIDVPEHLDNDFEYHVTRYDQQDDKDFFRVDIVGKRSLKKLTTMPKDVVFLVDTSGSIPQLWVQQIIRGVSQSLASLNEGDRFNIVLFNESPAFFSTDGPAPATAENLERAGKFLTRAESRGWTDMNAALSRLLVRDLQADRVYNLILITDGKPTRGVLDTRELINLITRDNDLAASIYCVGVGREPNRELLDFLAYRNKGFCLFADRIDQVATAVRDLTSRLRYPLIKNVRLSVIGAGTSEVYPMDLPNIHQGERFSVFGRFAKPGPFTMRVIGSNAGQGVDFTFTRDLNDAPQGDKQIAYDWAFWKLHHLYSEIIRSGDSEALREQIREIRRTYKLKTLY